MLYALDLLSTTYFFFKVLLLTGWEESLGESLGLLKIASWQVLSQNWNLDLCVLAAHDPWIHT